MLGSAPIIRKVVTVPVAVLATVGANLILRHYAGPLPEWTRILICMPVTFTAIHIGWAKR